MSSSLAHCRQQAPSGVNSILFARFVVAAFLGSIFFASSASPVRAQSSDSQQSSQDVAEAARQERARKQQPPAEHHVYTNEDLRRGKILTPEDQTRAAANRKRPAAPTAKPNTEPLDANSGKPQEPLGEVARRYRNLRREAIHPSPFHLPSNQPELAAPKILAPVPELKPTPQPRPPARNFAPVNPSTPIHRAPSVSAPALPSIPSHRVDPFSRRRVQPIPPAMAIRPVEPRTSAQPNFPPSVQPNLPSASRSPRSTKIFAQSIIVRQGDTLWTLSRQHLGRGTRWLELMAANPNLPDPTRLAPGTTLVLPSRVTSQQAKSQLHSFTVQAGDTLSKIALATYGHASSWPCIAHANPTLSNPHLLSIGRSLTLPASCQQ
ncbi:MAG TPA: LysM peptidoglycan-binding domain-containing protein [Candidatus Dormibacteraeota bacterium]|jgi:nucleoid-associated protein YgaU|nr:LysM peptidoglycan-binding domain-containing protein [Candidatus Dormibacteraeota bacterium]